MRPSRWGLSSTFSSRSFEPGTISAATKGNAAEDGSPGTATSCARRRACPPSVTMFSAPDRWLEILAPNSASMFSVWSRVMCFSRTVVFPGAPSPASKIADLTCAEANSGATSKGRGCAAPVIVNGRRPVPLSSIWAPVCASGCVTRAIGRRVNEASPVNSADMPAPATTPITRRAPVPELPKSSAWVGVLKPAGPQPPTSQTPSPRLQTVAPNWRMAWAVASTSSPSKSPVMRLVPVAMAARISARCDIDLSPGTRKCPLSGAGVRSFEPCGVAGLSLILILSREICVASSRMGIWPPKGQKNNVESGDFAFDSRGASWQGFISSC